MVKKYVQAELSASDYQILQEAIEHEHMTLKQALREAAMQWAYKQLGRQDPIFDIIGMVSGPTDLSENHDQLYDE